LSCKAKGSTSEFWLLSEQIVRANGSVAAKFSQANLSCQVQGFASVLWLQNESFSESLSSKAKDSARKVELPRKIFREQM
jgi:hypothetical protein